MIENLSNLTIGRQLREGRADRTAILFGDAEISYGALASSVMRAMAEIALLVKTGDRVAIVMPDCPAFVASFFGAVAAGAIATPINPRLDPTTIGETVARIKAPVAIVHSSLIEQLGQTLVTAKCRVIVKESKTDGQNLPWDARGMRGAGSDPAYCIFSSGTTGLPKAVVHDHLGVEECLKSFEAGVFAIRSQDRILAAPKLTFGYGLVGNAIFAMLKGASSILIEEPYRVDLFERALNAYRPTMVLAQPKVIADFIAGNFPRDLTHSARVWLSAGETLSPSLYDKWTEKYQIPLFDVLGATELGHVFIANTDLKSRPGSAGQVLPGFEARIVDLDGHEAPAGRQGELVARGVGMTRQYLDDVKRCVNLSEAGWIHTGDLASCSADGHYTVYGRVDDLIKVGCGEWILPIEFEQIINADPDVTESAVIGRRSPSGLTEACAFVVLRSLDVDREKVTQRLRLAVQTSYPNLPHKRLGSVEYIERVPRTINGKIARMRLRIEEQEASSLK